MGDISLAILMVIVILASVGSVCLNIMLVLHMRGIEERNLQLVKYIKLALKSRKRSL